MDSASGVASSALVAGIIVGSLVLIISIIILIWFIVSLSDMKRYLKSIDAKATKANLNLYDIKLYCYQLSSSAKGDKITVPMKDEVPDSDGSEEIPE